MNQSKEDEYYQKVEQLKKIYSAGDKEQKLNILSYCFTNPFTMKEIDIYNMIISDKQEKRKEECLDFYYELGGIEGLEEEDFLD